MVIGFQLGNLSAQNVDDEFSEFAMEDLFFFDVDVVTASRKAQNILEAPSNIIVITAEVIEQRGYRTLEEVLMDLPGFDFPMPQPTGEYPTHFIFRGISNAGQTKVLVMVDGIVQNDISNGWSRNIGFDFTLNDIDRIEVISGPGSALYGANAYVGLINVITKRCDLLFDDYSTEDFFLETKTTIGVDQMISPEVLAAYKFKNGLIFSLAGRWYKTDGDHGVDRYDPGNYFHQNYEPDSVLTTEYGNIANGRNPDGSRKRISDGFKNDISDFYLRGQLQKGGFTFSSIWWCRQEGLATQTVGYEYFANKAELDYQAHHEGYSAFASYVFDFNNKIKSESKTYYRNTRILPETGFLYTYQFQSVDNGIDPPVKDKKKGYNGEGFLVGFEQQLNIAISEKNEIILGFQAEQKIRQYQGISLGSDQDPNSTIIERTYFSEESSVEPTYFSRNVAIFAQDELRLAENHRLTASLRYDWDGEYGSALNPRFGFVTSPLENLNIKFLYGQAYQAPTIFELHDEWRGNKELEPQEIATSEIELNYRFSNHGNIRANFFYSNLKDLIVENENPDTTQVPIGSNGEHAFYYQNIGSTNMNGLAVSGDFQILGNLSLSANYMLTVGADGNEINNIAQHKMNFILNYLLKDKLNLNLRTNWSGRIKAPESNRYFHPKNEGSIAEVGYDYVTEDNPDGYLDGHVLLHLTLTGKNLFGHKLNLEPQLIIRNLLDEPYLGLGRQSGSGVRPINDIQSTIQNPDGFIPAYHPQANREIFVSLKYQL